MANQNFFEATRLLVRGSEMAERLSPAQCLDLIVGHDEEGWAEYEAFITGARFLTRDGRLYQVMGFTYQNTIIARPIGLDADPAVVTVELLPAAFAKWDRPEEVEGYAHKDGLVMMRG
jgi:hypothetical protein